MDLVQLSSLVRSKRHGTVYVLGPKGKAWTFRLRAPSFPNTKLGHLDRMCHWTQRQSYELKNVLEYHTLFRGGGSFKVLTRTLSNSSISC